MARAKTVEPETQTEIERAAHFDFTPENSRSIKVGKFIFPVRNRFSLGQTLDEVSTVFANAMMADQVRASFYSIRDKMTDEGATDEEIAAAWALHEQNYEWSPRVSRETLSPRDKMIRKVAREIIDAQVRALGRTLKGADPAVLDAAIAKLMTKQGKEIEAEADRRLSLASVLDSDDLEGFAQTKASAADESDD